VSNLRVTRRYYATLDEMVRGIVSALRQISKLSPAGKEGHVAVVGLDGTPPALDRIRQGTQDASVGQDPNAMGRFILDVIIGYFEGKPFEAKGSTRPFSSRKKMSTIPVCGATLERKSDIQVDEALRFKPG
jgi:ribose transport system substrate-binding protein